MKKYIYIIALILTMTSCESNDSSSAAEVPVADGVGGSLATFSLVGNYLYTVDQQSLNVFSLASQTQPVQVNTVPIGFDIETLFSRGEYLYIGSRFAMYIYGISNPEQPEFVSAAQHFTACDPIIANDNYAFVTLFSQNICGTGLNELQVYDVTDITNPILINTRGLIQPKGIGLYGDYLFVCDDVIKIFDVSDPTNMTLINSIDRSAFDLIIYQDKIHAIGDGGLYQYSLNPNDINQITPLSSILF